MIRHKHAHHSHLFDPCQIDKRKSASFPSQCTVFLFNAGNECIQSTMHFNFNKTFASFPQIALPLHSPDGKKFWNIWLLSCNIPQTEDQTTAAVEVFAKSELVTKGNPACCLRTVLRGVCSRCWQSVFMCVNRGLILTRDGEIRQAIHTVDALGSTKPLFQRGRKTMAGQILLSGAWLKVFFFFVNISKQTSNVNKCDHSWFIFLIFIFSFCTLWMTAKRSSKLFSPCDASLGGNKSSSEWFTREHVEVFSSWFHSKTWPVTQKTHCFPSMNLQHIWNHHCPTATKRFLSASEIPLCSRIFPVSSHFPLWTSLRARNIYMKLPWRKKSQNKIWYFFAKSAAGHACEWFMQICICNGIFTDVHFRIFQDAEWPIEFVLKKGRTTLRKTNLFFLSKRPWQDDAHDWLWQGVAGWQERNLRSKMKTWNKNKSDFFFANKSGYILGNFGGFVPMAINAKEPQNGSWKRLLLDDLWQTKSNSKMSEYNSFVLAEGKVFSCGNHETNELTAKCVCVAGPSWIQTAVVLVTYISFASGDWNPCGGSQVFRCVNSSSSLFRVCFFLSGVQCISLKCMVMWFIFFLKGQFSRFSHRRFSKRSSSIPSWLDRSRRDVRHVQHAIRKVETEFVSNVHSASKSRRTNLLVWGEIQQPPKNGNHQVPMRPNMNGTMHISTFGKATKRTADT